MNAAYSRVESSMGTLAYDSGFHGDETLIRDHYTSDGTMRQPSDRKTLAAEATKVLSVAEKMMAETLRRVKDDGIVGLFESARRTGKSSPMVVELRSRIEIEGEAAKYLGVYIRDKGEIRGRSHWRHFERPDQCLAFDGTCWQAQPESYLGDSYGILRLQDSKVSGARSRRRLRRRAAP